MGEVFFVFLFTMVKNTKLTKSMIEKIEIENLTPYFIIQNQLMRYAKSFESEWNRFGLDDIIISSR